MPCIKKRSSKIKKKKETPIVDMEKVLRETFSLKDFLNCEKTSQILQDNWYLDFTSKYEGKLEELYETERKYFRENISTLFYYDTDGTFVSHLKEILYKHIKPKYDLEVFYENPHLAMPLIDKIENLKETNLLEHQKNIKETYKKHQENTENDNKKTWRSE